MFRITCLQGDAARRAHSPSALRRLVWVFIGWVYTVTTIYGIIHEFGVSVFGALHFILYTALFALISLAFVRCCYADPGEVPPDTGVPLRDPESGDADGATRTCTKCQPPRIKPARTHHCSHCINSSGTKGRCVLKMDHHCVWMDNCVGWKNHKAFILFLVYVTVAAVYSFALLAYRFSTIVMYMGPSEFSSAPASFLWLMGVDLMVVVPVGAGVGSLLSWHCYLIARNVTTIEYLAEEVSRLEEDGGRKDWRFPYDEGRAKNLREVFGEGPWYTWLLPTLAPDVPLSYWSSRQRDTAPILVDDEEFERR
eukprot:tig00000241_g20875.t2